MKSHLGKYLAVLALVLLTTSAWAQKKVYTRGVRLQDFPGRTTKVVLDPEDGLSRSLRSAVTSVWTVSPYEFISEKDYQSLRTDNGSYFLSFTTNGGIIYLTLSKGGKENESNMLNAPFDVVSVPVSGENGRSGREDLYMPAFLDIIQDFVLKALDSESLAYGGLGMAGSHMPRGCKLYTDPAEADSVFAAGTPNTAVELVITPDGNAATKKGVRCTLRFASDTHKLYSYGKSGR